ncbi:TetR/AcrR family transcriptional regulator [Clostridium sp. WILCCON 0269]|uniref:TetR/AcrR family transcriptional regulator n=1 Tax=Candidatus Clostridium eludens TaxID=3381663 RepID=A0ABW8SP35_9CLOT
MNAAASVFAEEGYYHATINNICKEAGISNGALYKYFKNKESLFFSVLDYITDILEVKVYKANIENSKFLYDDVYNLLKGIEKLIEDYPDYISIYCDLGSSSMKRFATKSSEKLRKATSIYTIKMVKESKKRGDIDKNIKDEIAAYLIDNYITLFAYSLVSEYHSKRMNAFFCSKNTILSNEDKLNLTIESLKSALKTVCHKRE